MVVTMENILAVLHPYEPDYSNASTMGPEALPHLETIVKSEGPLLASKAAYLPVSYRMRDPLLFSRVLRAAIILKSG